MYLSWLQRSKSETIIPSNNQEELHREKHSVGTHWLWRQVSVHCQNYPKCLKEGILQCSLPIDSNIYFKCTAEECVTLKTET